jgi:cysteine desulfurase / selenocysteine lyase
MNKFNKLRSDFPILQQKVNQQPLCYLDNAATTQKPQQVLDAMMHFYQTSNANIYRGAHTFAEQATALYEQARQKAAQFIGAHNSSEIIFTRGTTESINFVASTWANKHIKSGDEILATELEHHANLLPWQHVAQQKGVELKFIPVLTDGTLDLSTLDRLLTKKTKLVAITQVSNAIGTHNPVKKIIDAAHSVGAKVLIDAAQSVPHQATNVQELNCDFLAFSGHKMLGPTGIGVLYIKKELHEEIPPYIYGGGMVTTVGWQQAEWLPAPQKFEAGTPPIAQAIGLGAAIDYLAAHINFDTLQAYEARLATQLIDGLSAMPQVKILGSTKELKKGHLVSFILNGIHAHDAAAYCDSKGISLRAGHHCAQPLAKKLGYYASLRASFYFYNTIQEVDCLISAISELSQ